MTTETMVLVGAHKVVAGVRTGSRYFTGTEMSSLLTNTAYQFQCLQDTFAFIQLTNILGTPLEWNCMQPTVSCSSPQVIILLVNDANQIIESRPLARRLVYLQVVTDHCLSLM